MEQRFTRRNKILLGLAGLLLIVGLCSAGARMYLANGSHVATAEDYETAGILLTFSSNRYPKDPAPVPFVVFWRSHNLQPNGEPEGVYPYLYKCAAQGMYGMTKFLIQEGWDPNEHRHDTTPIHFAASGNDARMVELLLALGADPNPPWYPQSPLDWAAMNGNKEAATALIANGGKMHRETLFDVQTLHPALLPMLEASPSIFQ